MPGNDHLHLSPVPKPRPPPPASSIFSLLSDDNVDLATVVAFFFANLNNSGGPMTSLASALSLTPSDLV
uniref:Uncharacterized protein n=1 Tax=Oryza nivara TaxID=4536 RepID=A0A0E0FLF5_ORYNI